VADMTASQASAKAEMDKLREAQRRNQDGYQFAGQSFTRQQVEDDLTRRRAKFENTRVRLEAKSRILDSRRQTLAAANFN
jgi:hypothetical protein